MGVTNDVVVDTNMLCVCERVRVVSYTMCCFKSCDVISRLLLPETI